MTTCSCDGPPHLYDPKWCGAGRATGSGEPINKRLAAAELELRAARLRAEADGD